MDRAVPRVTPAPRRTALGHNRPVTDLLAHPAAQSVALPVTVAVVLLTVFHAGGARHHGAAAVTAAVMVSALVTLGLSEWPPRTGMHKVPWLLAAGLAAGVVLDLISAGRGVRFAGAVAFVAAALAWLAWPQRAGAGAVVLVLAALGLAAALLVLVRLARHEEAPAPAAVMLLVAAAALAVVAFESGSLSIAQLCAALAAASGVLALWSLLIAGGAFGASGVLGAGGALVVLGTATALLTDVPLPALAVLLVVFFADVPPARYRLTGFAQALAVGALALLPAAGAVALTVWLRVSTGPYYQ